MPTEESEYKSVMIEPSLLCMYCMKELDAPEGICPHCGADNANCNNAAHQLSCGSILAGTYVVGHVLGQGGFGITYIGWDINLGIRVAIKEYYPEGFVTRDMRSQTSVLLLSDEKRSYFEFGRDRFINEAKLLAQFSGEAGIVGIRSFFNENGTAYIVMDYIEGETLKAYVARRGGRLPAGEVLSRFQKLFQPLSRVHKAGLLHRDISPDNIMLTKDGNLVLLDFGAARQMSITGEHSNTINVKHGFAPEEQYRKRGEQGSWTDVYAFCATIYCLITGITPPEALDQLMNEDALIPPNSLGAGLPESQQRAIMHGLAVRAKDRTQSLDQLYSELYLNQQPLITHKLPKWVIPSAAGAIAVVALVLALVLSTKGKRQDVMAQNPVLNPIKQTTLAPLSNSGSNLATPAITGIPTPTTELTPTTEPTAIPYQPTAGNARNSVVATGAFSTILLKSDGTVLCLGDSTINTSGWNHIIQVAADGAFAIGLRSDGTVVAAGDLSHGEGDVYNWRDVVEVDCGYQHTIAVTSAGTVYYTGFTQFSRTDSRNWTNVKKVLAGSDHVAAILNDGTMVGAGYNKGGQCNLDLMEGVLDGDVGNGSTFCVMPDGTVFVMGTNWCGEDNVQGWTDIIAVSTASEHTVGLKSDGTVVAVGSNKYGECDVEGWTNIVAIATGGYHTIGVKSDGTLIATGSNNKGQCNVSGIKLW